MNRRSKTRADLEHLRALDRELAAGERDARARRIGDAPGSFPNTGAGEGSLLNYRVVFIPD